MMPINPYIAGNPVGGTPNFVCRADVLREVLRVLRHPNQNAIVLYGQRRIGKTSILQQLADQLPNEGPFHSVYFDLQDKAAWPLGRVLVEIALTIAYSLNLPAPDLGNDPALEFRSGWLPTILQNLPRLPKKQIEVTDTAGVTRKVPVPPQPSTSLVLLFDEFDVLADPKRGQAGADLFPYLRQLMSLDPARLKFVFVIGRKIEDLESIALSLFKGAPSLRVSLLDHADTVQLVRLSEQNETLHWTEEALEKVWELAHGHPFLTQQLCSRVWENLYDEDPSSTPTVTHENVEQAIGKTLEASRNTMEWLWDGLPPAERVVISALAKMGNEPISQEQLEQMLRESGVRVVIRELQNASQLLQDWDLLESVEEGFQFRVELLRRWILKHKPLNRVQEELDRLIPLAENLYQAAIAYYRAGQADLAENQVLQAVVSNPNHVRANQLLAEILLGFNKISDAIVILKHLFLIRPDLAKSRLIQALFIQAETEKVTNAKLDIYDQILKIDVENQEAILAKKEIWQFRGNEALKRDNLLEAKEAFTQANLLDKVKEIEREMLMRSIKTRLDEIVQLEQGKKYDETLSKISNLEHYISKNLSHIPRSDDILETLIKKSKTIKLTILSLYEEEKRFEDAIILIKNLSIEFPHAQNWDDYLSRITQLSKIDSLYQEALASLRAGNKASAMKQLANVIYLKPSYENAAQLLYVTVVSESEADLVRNSNLKRLSPKNPLNPIVLLLWVLVAPNKLRFYQYLYGYKEDLVGPQALLISSLTWIPFLYPIIGIYFKLFIEDVDQIYLFAVGIIAVLFLWVVYLSVLRVHQPNNIKSWWDSEVIIYYLLEVTIIGAIFAFLCGGKFPGNFAMCILILVLYFVAKIIGAAIYRPINFENQKSPLYAFHNSLQDYLFFASYKLIGPIIGISVSITSFLTVGSEGNALFSLYFLISFIFIAVTAAIVFLIGLIYFDYNPIVIVIGVIIYLLSLYFLPFWIALKGVDLAFNSQEFLRLSLAFYGNLVLVVFISTVFGIILLLLEQFLVNDIIMSFNTGQSTLLGRGLFYFILVSHILLMWFVFLGGWRVIQ